MKKLFLAFLVLTAFVGVRAQQISGGFRTGTSYWMNVGDGQCPGDAVGKNLSWDKEFFIRYNTKGKLAFEFSMGHYATKSSYVPKETDQFSIPEYRTLNIRERSQNLEWNISAQYDATCACMQSCPLLKKMKSYIGIVVTPTLSRMETQLNYVDGVSEGSLKSTTTSRDDFSVWTGLSHTLVYNLCERMYISSAVRLQVDPNTLFDGELPETARNGRFGFQLGLGYNIR